MLSRSNLTEASWCGFAVTTSRLLGVSMAFVFRLRDDVLAVFLQGEKSKKMFHRILRTLLEGASCQIIY